MTLRHFVAVALLPLLAACSSSSNPTHAAAARAVKNHGFVRAKITRHFDEHDNKVAASTKTVEDPVQLQKLIMFFPGMETGRRSPTVGDWKPKVEVRFFREDGSSYFVKSNYVVWSEGDGDFPIRGAFRQFVAGVFGGG